VHAIIKIADNTVDTVKAHAMKIHVNISFISIFYLFPVLNNDFIIYTNLTHIAASNTKPMTSQIRSRIEYLIKTYKV